MKIRELVISKREFDGNRQPATYETWEGNICTYVGFSAHGFARVFAIASASGNHPNRAIAFARADRVLVSFYESVDEAIIAEENLIHARHPRYNLCCPDCAQLHGPGYIPEFDPSQVYTRKEDYASN